MTVVLRVRDVLSSRRSLWHEPVRSAQDAVADRVGERGMGEIVVPVFRIELTGTTSVAPSPR